MQILYCRHGIHRLDTDEDNVESTASSEMPDEVHALRGSRYAVTHGVVPLSIRCRLLFVSDANIILDNARATRLLGVQVAQPRRSTDAVVTTDARTTLFFDARWLPYAMSILRRQMK